MKRIWDQGAVLMLCAIFILAVLSACSADTDRTPEESQVEAPNKLVYEMKSLKKEFGTPGEDSTEYAVIEFRYPEFQAAPSAPAKEALENSINKFFLNPIFEGKTPATWEINMDDFIEDYKSFKKEFPEAPYTYYLKRTINIIHETPSIASLEYSEESFTGGAHPNETRMFKNYDLIMGTTISLSDIFVPGYSDELTAVAEKTFRTIKELSPDAGLEEAGFAFEKGKFILNDNFSIRETGITFFYNSYEIAPYAMGATELHLDYEQIKNLIQKDGLLDDKHSRRSGGEQTFDGDI